MKYIISRTQKIDWRCLRKGLQTERKTERLTKCEKVIRRKRERERERERTKIC